MEKQASKLLAQRLAHQPTFSLVALQVVAEVEKELGRQATLGNVREVLTHRNKLVQLANTSHNPELLCALSAPSEQLDKVLATCAELLTY